jgi:hypothetical protein
MLPPIEFTFELVENDPPELAEQMIFLHEKNLEFSKAIKEHNYQNLYELLEAGAPFSTSVISEDDQKCINVKAIEGLDNSFKDIFIHYIINRTFAQEKEDIIELLGEYFVLSSHSELREFRKCYFAKTQNQEKALEYFTKIMSNLGGLRRDKMSLISGAMYNDNHEIFKNMLAIYEQYDEFTDNHITPLTSSFHLSQALWNTILNKESLALYYDKYFYETLDYQMNKGEFRFLENYSQEEAIDDLFSRFLSNHFYLMQTDNDHTKPSEIINLFMYEYAQFSETKESDFIELQLAYSQIQNVDRECFIMAYKAAQRHSNFATIQRNRKEKAIVHFQQVLKTIIEKNEPGYCLEKLQKMKIDNSYYPELVFYSKMTSNLIKNSIKEEKVKKI